MNPLHRVGVRLSLALAVLVAGALGLVYLVVVPSLERNLVDSKLTELRREALLLSRGYNRDPHDPDFITDAAAAADARVVLLSPFSLPEGTLFGVIDDSRSGPAEELQDEPIAERAVEVTQLRSGTVNRGDTRFAEAAVPLADGTILLLSASLRDALANVDHVQRRLLQAGVLALLGSILVGYGAASFFARRIRRLERAADRIAGGSFDEPVVDESADELGQLAQAFERMRGRLAQLDHARRAFIANASHELRTPLFSLGGFLELLTDEDLDAATRREFLETMREQVERLTKLATELLDLSRLDAGRIHVHREHVDLALLADTLIDDFRAVARARGHELEAVSDEAMGIGDVDRAHQIGSVLVENALVHTPPGTRVCVRTSRRDGMVELAVEDDGPGIAAEHEEHVFERFYRIEGAVAHGSGLGLAIARELAELMGGSVELESQPGRTVFRLELPASAAVAEPVLAPTA